MKGEKQMIIIQAIDISTSILYDNAKASEEYYQMSNASVSHEMRNPLNSIMSINILKTEMYNRIDDILEESPNQ